VAAALIREGVPVALEPGRAVRLARSLRDLRESEWPGVDLTQAQLAKALSVESRVASATLSSWESLTNPKTPTPRRLSAYARFFATRRSLDGGPHLIPEKDLTADETERYHELEAELLGLLPVNTPARRETFSFDEGQVTIICPEVPAEELGRLADPGNPNLNRFHRFADLDAMLELWGHVRVANPSLICRIRLPSEVVADDLSGHVILLGGIGWNRVTRRIQTEISQVPITQVRVPELDTGEIFTVKDANGERSFFPDWFGQEDGDRELVEDVGHIARLRNPFQSSRTLTICNGIHTRGVLGAVRCLTDVEVRDANERYLAERFPEGRFALLVRVPVVANETISPDLQNPATRLYEWVAPTDGTPA
jgi:transcriptional regulator with XRE-family HTH domain